MKCSVEVDLSDIGQCVDGMHGCHDKLPCVMSFASRTCIARWTCHKALMDIFLLIFQPLDLIVILYHSFL